MFRSTTVNRVLSAAVEKSGTVSYLHKAVEFFACTKFKLDV